MQINKIIDSFFNTKEWNNLIEYSNLGYKNISIKNDNLYIPGIEKSIYSFNIFMSSGLGGYGGIFGDIEKSKSIIINLKKKYSYVEFIFSPLSKKNVNNLLNELRFVKKTYKAHILPLQNNIYDKYNRMTRRHLKENKNFNLQIKDISGAVYYYKIFKNNITKWRKTDYLGISFFEQMDNIDAIKIEGVFLDKELVGGIVYFIYGKEIFLWSMGQIDRLIPNKCSPSKELYNHIIEKYSGNDFIINFGASDKLPNVRRIKEGFGAKEVEYNTYVYMSLTFKILLKIKSLLLGKNQ